MVEEILDVLDVNGNKTGETKTKSKIKEDGNYHGAISVCVVNKDKEILMHRRSSIKRVYPNLWSIFVRGHISSGETEIEACIRELGEEMGIYVQEDTLKFLYKDLEEKTTRDGKYIENIIYTNYLLITEFDMDDINLQEEEVSDAKKMYYKDIQKQIEEDSEEFVPNFDDYKKYFKIIDELN